ncbi:MAG: hypothetical protein ACYC6R_12360, partial [Anaerolineales bacterium]
SAVPVLLRGEIILPELCPQTILASRACLNSQNWCLKSLTHTDERDQILEILVYGNYLSPKDLAILNNYDVQKLNQEQNFENIQSLATTLTEMYQEEYKEEEEDEEEEEE